MAIITCSGELRVDDAKESVVALWKHPGWSGKSTVWDFRASRFILTAEEVQELAHFVLSNQPDTPPERVAFVTGREVDFGLARMFDAFRRDPRTAFKVFREFDAALSWASTLDTDAI